MRLLLTAIFSAAFACGTARAVMPEIKTPDVVIMDLRMPVKDGADATAEIHEQSPAAKILILTSFGEADGVAHALECGAMGAITKTAEDAELLSVVRKIAAGGQFISPEIEKMLKDKICRALRLCKRRWPKARGTLGEYAVSPRSDLRSPASLPPHIRVLCKRSAT